MTHVTLKSGSEGPRHDPYHYDEYTVARPNGDTVVMHNGIFCWCRVKRGTRIVFENTDEATAPRLFETYAGVSFRAFEKAWHSLPERRSRSHFCNGVRRGYRDFACVSGYPGETFTVCIHCKDVIDSSFDRSAVE